MKAQPVNTGTLRAGLIARVATVYSGGSEQSLRSFMQIFNNRLTILLVALFALASCNSSSGGGGDNNTNTLSAPQNLTAASPQRSQVDLTWKAVDGATSYLVYQGDTKLDPIADGTTDTISQSIDGLVNGETYSFRVKAVKDNTESGFSNTATVTLAYPPDAPHIKTVTAGTQRATVEWDAVTGATSYTVYWQQSGVSPDVHSDDVSADKTSYTVTGLDQTDDIYNFWVTAFSAHGESATSELVSTTPIARLIVTARSGDGKVDLSWNAIAGVTSYAIYVNGSTQPFVFARNTTSYSVTNLTNGTAYNFSVRVGNARSEPVSATPVATPTGLVASAGDSKVELTWDAADGADSYSVSWVGRGDITTDTTTDTAYTATDLSNDTTYRFFIKATNSTGESNLAQIDAKPIAAPATPTGLAATAANEQVTLTWSPVANADSYAVQWVDKSTAIATDSTTDITNTVYVITDLTNDQSYDFRVKAINNVGESDFSDSVVATPEALSAPTGLAATVADKQVTLTWNPVANADSYAVQWVDKSTDITTDSTTDITNTVYVVRDLTNDQSYDFRVKAINSDEESDFSDWADATPDGNPQSTTSDFSLSAIAGDSNVVLTWDAVAGATSYMVRESRESSDGSRPDNCESGKGKPIFHDVGTALSYTATDLTNDQTYYFCVIADGKFSDGKFRRLSDVVSATLAPATPTGLAATVVGNQANVSWNAVDNATIYKTIYNIYVNGNLDKTSDSTQDTVDNLVVGYPYDISVEASNDIGKSPRSDAVSVTPLAAPTGLAATVGDERVTLAWNAVANADSYAVQWVDKSTGITTDSTTDITDTVYVVTDLTNNQPYDFQVKAIDSTGESNFSDSVEATPVLPPSTPTNLRAVAGDGKIDLSWDAVTGATTYEVYRNGNTSPEAIIPLREGVQLYSTTAAINNGTRYSFHIKAVNESGKSDPISDSATPVATPTGLVATVGHERVTLDWDAAVGAESYTVFWKDATGDACATTDNSRDTGDALSYTVTDLTNGTQYRFCVQASNSNNGRSNMSVAVSAAPQLPKPDKAPVIELNSVGDGTVTLQWGTVPNATEYTIYQDDVSIDTTSDTHYTVTNLTNGVTYSFRVKAVNSAAESDFSNQIQATPNKAPSAPEGLSVSFHSVKIFRFSWQSIADATYYRLQENPDGLSGFRTVADNIPATDTSYDLQVPLYARANAQYIVQACYEGNACSNSNTVAIADNMVNAIGYFKASNTDTTDDFGYSVSLHGDTLAVGAPFEDSLATGIDSSEDNNTRGFGFNNAGAVYVFARDDNGGWTQQAYIKASNTDGEDKFGHSVSLHGDTLAVGAYREDSNATGIDGDQSNNSAEDSGAVYVFTRNDTGDWTQDAYIKASNTDAGDEFGTSVSLHGDTLAVGARFEDSNARGIVGGDQNDNSASGAGAVYVFTRSGTTWSQQAYIKASNTDRFDFFGTSVSLHGDTLAVGATGEDSNATGVNPGVDAQSNNVGSSAGAVYVFTRDTNGDWTQDSYIKASNTKEHATFGNSVSLYGDTLADTLAVGAAEEDSKKGAVYVFTRSGTTWSQQQRITVDNLDSADSLGNSVSLHGDTLAVGVGSEDSNARGIGGDQNDNSAPSAGAVYVFARDDNGGWTQQAYIKASNTEADQFGNSVSLHGDTLAVGARFEDSNARGIGGDQNDNSAPNAGAVYVY